MSDPYVDEHGTLHNLLGITDARVLAEVEFEITALRLEALDRDPLAGNYDLGHLCRFHQYLFRDVYQWAGELRTVDIAKGNELFCLAQHIESAAGDVFARVGQVRADLQEHRGLIPVSMADLYGDINALHPFREGNGRTQRVFLRQLARDHGARLNWSLLDPAAHVEASIAAQRGDTRGLHAALRIAARQQLPDGTLGWGQRLTARD